MLSPVPVAPSERFIPIKDFARRASLSRGTLYNLVQRGELPQPIRLTANRVAWPESVVNAWFDAKLKGAA